jgi:hypothetical protein
MSLSTLAFSVAIGLLSFDSPPEPAPVAPSEPAPAPAPATTPAPTPAPAPAQTYPVQPGYQDPYAQPAPTPAPAYEPDEPTGIGMMVTGPLLVAVGVPFSLLGNASWRENCGPLDSDSACFGGTAGAIASHAVAGVAFGTGILLTGLGAQRKGTYDGKRDPSRSATGFVTGGAVLLPLSLAGMLAVRTVLLTEAIDCEVQSCVAQFQNVSTITVSALALTASAGAGLMMYGIGYNRGRQRAAMLMPAVGRNFAGLSLTGRF